MSATGLPGALQGGDPFRDEVGELVDDITLDNLLNSYLGGAQQDLVSDPLTSTLVSTDLGALQPLRAAGASAASLTPPALQSFLASMPSASQAADGQPFPMNLFAAMPPLPPMQFVANPNNTMAAHTTSLPLPTPKNAGHPPPPALVIPTSSAQRATTESPDSPDQDSDLSCGDSATSQEKKSKKKRQTDAGKESSTAERKQLALQEKNRRAQRRFRERQKAKIQELHSQIEELTSRVSNLQTENATLHSRTSILQKVLDMRNEQIQVMQESKETTQVGTPLDADPTQGPLTLSAMAGQVVSLTSEVVRELSPDQICRIYQAYANELSARIMELSKAGPSHAEVLQHIEKLTREVERLLMRLSVLKPVETKKFVAISRQYLSSETQAIELWTNVVKTLNLSDQQKKDIVQLKQLYLQKMEPVMDERRKLHVQIQADLPHETFHTRNAITYIKTHEAVARLRENLRTEQNVTLEFCTAVFRGVLQGLQMAYLLVQSYPVVPDALAVASAIATLYGDQLQLPTFRAPNLAHLDAGNGFHMLHLSPNMLTLGSNSQSALTPAESGHTGDSNAVGDAPGRSSSSAPSEQESVGQARTPSFNAATPPEVQPLASFLSNGSITSSAPPALENMWALNLQALSVPTAQ